MTVKKKRFYYLIQHDGCLHSHIYPVESLTYVAFFWTATKETFAYRNSRLRLALFTALTVPATSRQHSTHFCLPQRQTHSSEGRLYVSQMHLFYTAGSDLWSNSSCFLCIALSFLIIWDANAYELAFYLHYSTFVFVLLVYSFTLTTEWVQMM